jgi:hypothetical protein
MFWPLCVTLAPCLDLEDEIWFIRMLGNVLFGAGPELKSHRCLQNIFILMNLLLRKALQPYTTQIFLALHTRLPILLVHDCEDDIILLTSTLARSLSSYSWLWAFSSTTPWI